MPRSLTRVKKGQLGLADACGSERSLWVETLVSRVYLQPATRPWAKLLVSMSSRVCMQTSRAPPCSMVAWRIMGKVRLWSALSARLGWAVLVISPQKFPSEQVVLTNSGHPWLFSCFVLLWTNHNICRKKEDFNNYCFNCEICRKEKQVASPATY